MTQYLDKEHLELKTIIEMKEHRLDGHDKLNTILTNKNNHAWCFHSVLAPMGVSLNPELNCSVSQVKENRTTHE